MLTELLPFLESLRRKGYSIGVGQQIKVQKLLAILADQNQFPDHPQQLATLLAPIVCTTPEEQETFYEDFNEWLTSLAQASQKETSAPDASNQSDSSSDKGTGAQSRFRHWRWVVPLGILLTLLITGGIYVNSILAPVPIKWPSPGELPAPPTPLQLQTEPLNYGPFYGDITTVKLQPSPVVIDNLENTFEPPGAFRGFLDDHYKLLCGLFTALPFFVIAAYWLYRKFRRLQLEKQRTAANPDLNHLQIARSAEKLFKGLPFRRIVQKLRRSSESSLSDLNVPVTVEYTVNRAGFFTPVYSFRKTASEYLFLMDRTGFSDHQAIMQNLLVRRLTENNVYIDRYYFHSDPRICYRTEMATLSLTLEDLLRTHPDHHLVLFSNGISLIDPLARRVYPWTEVFSAWSSRALLTPQPVVEWDEGEQILRQAGFTVLPATQEGLAQILDSAKDERTDDDLDLEPRLPKELLQNPERWISQIAPASNAIEALRIELLHYLGVEDYYWLCACAIYPMIHWDLTLYLGSQLTTGEQFEERLSKLIRLPWFRYAVMPDWLRDALIASLPEARERAVRDSVEALLLTAQDKTGAVQLTIARSELERRSARFYTLGKELWARLRELLRKDRAASPAQASEMNSPLKDMVFLTFMSGRKPSRLALAVPAALRRLLLTHGSPSNGFRVAPVLIGAALISVSLFMLFPKRPQPVPRPPDPPQMRMPNSTVIAIPASGSPGGRFAMRVISSNPEELSLKDSLLMQGASRKASDGDLNGPASGSMDEVEYPLPGISAPLRLDIIATKTSDAQLDAFVTVSKQAPVGMIPVYIVKDGRVQGTFNFQVVNKPDIRYTLQPTAGDRRSKVDIRITSLECSFPTLEGASLALADGSQGGITILNTNSSPCALTATLDISAQATPGPVVLNVFMNGQILTTVTFTVRSNTLPLFELIPSTVTNPGKPEAGFAAMVITRDCDNFDLTNARLISRVAYVAIEDSSSGAGCGFQTVIRILSTVPYDENHLIFSIPLQVQAKNGTVLGTVNLTLKQEQLMTIQDRINRSIEELTSQKRVYILKNAKATPQSMLADLGISNGAMQFSLKVEFKIEIPDQDANQWQTVGDLYRYITQRLKPARPRSP